LTGRRRGGAWIWFALMLGGWAVFFILLGTDEPRLHELWTDVRGLPLLVEGLVWFALFPFVLALGFWSSGWDEGLRFALVSGCALLWSFLFVPRSVETT
jgi:hypothetical protein